MPKFILRFLALSIVSAAGAFGQQGTFGQIAYGGSWQTTFTLTNVSPSGVATVTLSFYGDSGSPLNAPVQGFGVTSAYTFAIPAGNAQNVVLSSSDTATTQGWASMSVTGGTVRGQGSFRFLVPNGTGAISEAVVPLTLPSSALCIVSFPQSNPVVLIPFDNTNGQYVTSLAVANITSNAQSYRDGVCRSIQQYTGSRHSGSNAQAAQSVRQHTSLSGIGRAKGNSPDPWRHGSFRTNSTGIALQLHECDYNDHSRDPVTTSTGANRESKSPSAPSPY